MAGLLIRDCHCEARVDVGVQLLGSIGDNVTEVSYVYSSFIPTR